MNQHLVGEAEMLVISTPGKKKVLECCSTLHSGMVFQRNVTHKKHVFMRLYTIFVWLGHVPIKNATFTDFMFMQIYIFHKFARHFYCPDYENFPDFTFHILVLRISFLRQWTCFPVSC